MDNFKEGKYSGAQFDSPKRHSVSIKNWFSSPQRKSQNLSQSKLLKHSSENQLYRLQKKSKLIKKSSKALENTKKTEKLLTKYSSKPTKLDLFLKKSDSKSNSFNLSRYSSKPTKLDLFLKKSESKSSSSKSSDNKTRKSVRNESLDSENNVSSSNILEKSRKEYFKTFKNSKKKLHVSKILNRNKSTDSDSYFKLNNLNKKETNNNNKNVMFDKIITGYISKNNESLEIINISSDSEPNISTGQATKLNETKVEPFFLSLESPIANSLNIFENEDNIISKISQATSTPEESKTLNQACINITKKSFSPKRKRIDEYFQEIKRVSQNRNIQNKSCNVAHSTIEKVKPLKEKPKNTVVIAECDSTSNYSDSSLSKTSSVSKNSYSAIFCVIDHLTKANSVNKKTELVTDSTISGDSKINLDLTNESGKLKKHIMEPKGLKKYTYPKDFGIVNDLTANESLDKSVFISVDCFKKNIQDAKTDQKDVNSHNTKKDSTKLITDTENLTSHHQRSLEEVFKTITSKKSNLTIPKSTEKIKKSSEYVQEKFRGKNHLLKIDESNFVLKNNKEENKVTLRQQFANKTTDILKTSLLKATQITEKVHNSETVKNSTREVQEAPTSQAPTSQTDSKEKVQNQEIVKNSSQEEIILKDDQELLAELAKFDNIKQLYENCNINFGEAKYAFTENRNNIEIIQQQEQDMKTKEYNVKKLKQNKRDNFFFNNLLNQQEQTQSNKAAGTEQNNNEELKPKKKAKKSYNIDSDCLLHEENMFNYLVGEKKKICRGLEVASHCESQEKEMGAFIKRYTKGDTKIFKIQPRYKKPEYKFPQPEENWEKILRVIEDQVSDDESVKREKISTPTSYKTDDDRSEVLSTGSGDLPPPQKMLRSGINKISKDKNLIFNKSKDTVPAEFNKNHIKRKICEILLDSVQRFEQGKIKELKWPADDLANCVFMDDRYQISQNPRLSVITYELTNRRVKYNLTLLILNKIRELLQNKSKLTKRELFYQLKPMINEQRISDRVIYEISRMLGVGMWALNLTAQKGLVFGNMKLVMSSGEVVNCNVPGTLIPADVTDITEIQSTAYFILVVEKDSIFNKLIEEDLPNKLTRPFIMITGKGFPDLNTQLFLKKLWMIMAIPVFVLVDPDPHGIGIMINYRFGSVANSHVSDHLAVPKSRWLGVLPSEIRSLSLPAQKLTEKDTKMLKKMLSMECVKRNPKIEEELQKMLEINLKASIEGLIKNDTYLSNVYLSLKFYNNKYI